MQSVEGKILLSRTVLLNDIIEILVPAAAEVHENGPRVHFLGPTDGIGNRRFSLFS